MPLNRRMHALKLPCHHGFLTSLTVVSVRFGAVPSPPPVVLAPLCSLSDCANTSTHLKLSAFLICVTVLALLTGLSSLTHVAFLHTPGLSSDAWPRWEAV